MNALGKVPLDFIALQSLRQINHFLSCHFNYYCIQVGYRPTVKTNEIITIFNN